MRDVASPREGAVCTRTPGTGHRAAPVTAAPLPGPARKGPPVAGNARTAIVHHLLSLLLPDSVSNLVSELDLVPEAFPSNTPDNRAG